MPEGQPLCPECYSRPDSETTSERTVEKVRKNVMIFFHAPVASEWFQERMLKYVPERVGWIFYAETPQAFREITRNSAGSWQLLIIDPKVVSENLELLDCFIQENPGIVVGIQYDFGINIPLAPPLKDAIMFRRPSDIDPWLLITHQLLNIVAHA